MLGVKKKKKRGGAPGWLSPLSEGWTLGFGWGHDLMGRGIELRVGLQAQDRVCLRFPLPLPPLVLSISLSNK